MNADELREWMDEVGVGATELGDAVGVDRRRIYQWLGGDPILPEREVAIRAALVDATRRQNMASGARLASLVNPG